MNDSKDNDGVCLHCGYCKHCGRGGHQVYPIYPYPYWPTYPYGPSWTGQVMPTITTGSVTSGANGGASTPGLGYATWEHGG